MKEIIDKVMNLYTLASFIFGVAVGGVTMYYSFIEKIHVLEVKVESLEKEDDNVHGVLHLHYQKLLGLKDGTKATD